MTADEGSLPDGDRAERVPWTCEPGRGAMLGLHGETIAPLAGPGDALRMIGLFDAPDDASVHAHVWECHDAGDELLMVARGRLALDFVDATGAVRTLGITAPCLAVVPSRCWHRLRVLAPAVLAFVTPMGRTRRSAQPLG